MGNFVSIILSRENLYNQDKEIDSTDNIKINIFHQYTEKEWSRYYMKQDNGMDIIG